MATPHAKKINIANFKRQRGYTNQLKRECDGGYEGVDKSAYHHILPVCSLYDTVIKPDEDHDFFHKCMAVTVWNINEKPNVIGLPTKRALLGVSPVIPPYPCHQNDHPEYSKGVIKYLQSKLWDELSARAAECKVDGVSILEQLTKGIRRWRIFLVYRGLNAADCWHNRNEPAYADKWYRPFSMHPTTPRPANPPAEGIVAKARLSEIFKAIT